MRARLQHLGDDRCRFGGPTHDAKARGQLQLRAVAVRLLEPCGQSLLVERDGRSLLARGVARTRQLEHEPGVTRVSIDEMLRVGDALSVVGQLPERCDLRLALVLTARGHDLATDGAGVVDGAALLTDPAVDLGTLRVAHECKHVSVVSVRHECP